MNRWFAFVLLSFSSACSLSVSSRKATSAVNALYHPAFKNSAPPQLSGHVNLSENQSLKGNLNLNGSENVNQILTQIIGAYQTGGLNLSGFNQQMFGLIQTQVNAALRQSSGEVGFSNDQINIAISQCMKNLNDPQGLQIPLEVQCALGVLAPVGSPSQVSVNVDLKCGRVTDSAVLFAEDFVKPTIEILDSNKTVIGNAPLASSDLANLGTVTKSISISGTPIYAVVCDASTPPTCDPHYQFENIYPNYEAVFTNGLSYSVSIEVRWNRAESLKVLNGGTSNVCNSDEITGWMSPLVVDLTGEGLSFSPPESSGVVFDLKADGHPVRTGWVASPNTAFLARDINHNGIIDNGAELFGNATLLKNGTRAANGFEALKDLVGHGGALTASDPAWKELVLWRDLNRNGITDPGELISLDDAGIQSINLDYMDLMESDIYGNQTRERSSVLFSDGLFSRIIDIWFRVEF